MGIISSEIITEQVRKSAETNPFIAQDMEKILLLEDPVQALLDDLDNVPSAEKSVCLKWIESHNIQEYGRFPSEFMGRLNSVRHYFLSTLNDSDKETVMYQFIRCALADIHGRGLVLCKWIAGYREAEADIKERLAPTTGKKTFLTSKGFKTE